MNAEALSGDALQALMRHKSYTTTQLYINMSRQLNRSAEKLHVPDVLKVSAGRTAVECLRSVGYFVEGVECVSTS
jgi:hypothetical protein